MYDDTLGKCIKLVFGMAIVGSIGVLGIIIWVVWSLLKLMFM